MFAFDYVKFPTNNNYYIVHCKEQILEKISPGVYQKSFTIRPMALFSVNKETVVENVN